MPRSQPGQDAIIQFVSARTGLQFPPTRYDQAVAGIGRAMARAQLQDPLRYLERLRSSPAAFDDLIAELTIGETYFFREPSQFEFVRREVLPEVLHRRGSGHVVRAWSAACSSGEEVYSLAILFMEAGLANQVYLLATDLSRAALAKAVRGEYRSWSLRDSGAPAASAYLRPGSDALVLDDRIRQLPTFQPLNLILDTYPSPAAGVGDMDLILCRNVLIYFDQETVHSVARRLYDSLSPGGWLLTASTDPPLTELAPFEAVLRKEGVFYRRPLALPLTPATVVPTFSPEFGVPPTTGLPVAAASSATPQAPQVPLAAAQPRQGRRSSALPKKGARPGSSPADSAALTAARLAFAAGDYARALALTEHLPEAADTRALQVRAQANLDLAAAERTCAAAVARQPLSAELHYLHAVLLLALGRGVEAAGAARRVLYLDRSLASAHFILGSILRSLGDLAGAQRAFRNARELCVARPPEEIVPLSDDERAGSLAAAAARELASLAQIQENAR